MDFRILGPLEVVDDGGPSTLGGARQRALLAILLLRRGKLVPAARLVEELYGAEPPATAAKSLQAHVSRLRKALRPPIASRAVPAATRCGSSPASSTPTGSRRNTKRGGTPSPRGGRRTRRPLLADALALWRGPPLADLAYEEFAQAELARLEELRLSCDRGSHRRRARARPEREVVAELEPLLARAPLPRTSSLPADPRALPLRQAVRGARGLPGRARERWSTGSASSRAGRCRSSSGRSSGRMPALDLSAAPRRRRTRRREAAFVGREARARRARRRPRRCARRARAALPAGRGAGDRQEPAGGRACAARAKPRRTCARGAVLGGGRCSRPTGRGCRRSAPTSAKPTRPRCASSSAPAPPTSRSCSPSCASSFPDLPAPPTLDAEGARFRLFDATAAFLEPRRRSRWSSSSTTSTPRTSPPSCCSASSRAELADPGSSCSSPTGTSMPSLGDPLVATLAELAREPVDPAHRAPRPGGSDVAAYIARPRASSRTQHVAQIHDGTDGNPLFVGELVRLLAAEGRLDRVDGSVLRAPGVREVIGQRLRRLSERVQGLLRSRRCSAASSTLDALERMQRRRPRRAPGPARRGDGGARRRRRPGAAAVSASRTH